MTAIRFAGISPHPPIIVHEVGLGRERETQRTIGALERLAEDLARHNPQTVLLMATHGPLNPGAFFLLTAPTAEGDFSRWGAPQVQLRFPTDPEVIAAIQEEARRAGLPLDASDRWNGGLDWSCTVPLYYLRRGLSNARLVPMNISFLSPQEHFQFGRAVRRAVESLNRGVVVIASADLSHRLSESGPYGFHPAGPEFDRRIQEAVASWDVQAVLTMDPSLRESAGEDAVLSISFLMGVLDGLTVRPRILSYEGPFGVGYMVAAVDILEREEERPYVRTERAEPRPAAPGEPTPELETVGGAHPLVRLARQAVEAYVLRGEVLNPPDLPALPDGLPERAGCFVSIKTREGVLRGCIGTVEPEERSLPQEVIRNAISSATHDPRFPPVSPEELPHLVYTVDVLSAPERVESTDELDPKRYGVIVKSGARRGLLLPDIEGVETVEQQVAIAKSKAFIAPEEPVEIWRFEVRRLR